MIQGKQFIQGQWQNRLKTIQSAIKPFGLHYSGEHASDAESSLLTAGILEVTKVEVPDEEYFGPLATIIGTCSTA